MTQLLNIGGLIKIEVALAENITLGLPNSNNEVAVTNSGNWDEISFTQGSASFSEIPKTVSEGTRYDQKLNWQLPKVGPDNYAIAHKYNNKQVVIKFTDANNTVYIIGSNTTPVYIGVSSKVPGQPSGLNGYNFLVNNQSTHPVRFVA